MKNESNFRDAVKTHAVEGSRNTLLTLVILALFVAVIFAMAKIAIEVARPFLPVHGQPAAWELRR